MGKPVKVLTPSTSSCRLKAWAIYSKTWWFWITWTCGPSTASKSKSTLSGTPAPSRAELSVKAPPTVSSAREQQRLNVELVWGSTGVGLMTCAVPVSLFFRGRDSVGCSRGDFYRPGGGTDSGGGRTGVSEEYIALSLSKRCSSSAL